MADTTHNKMFAQWWGSVLVQSAIFVQRLVTWDSEAFQIPTTAQTQTLWAIKDETMKLLSVLGLIFLLSSFSYGQDTLRLKRKPEVILKSWYPEFKEFPKLKVGENKILFTIIPDFEKLSIRDNDINLVVIDDLAKIEETEKTNQYLVTVFHPDKSYIEFEVWFDIGNLTILVMDNSKWTDIKKIYPCKDKRVMLQKIKLKIEN